MRAASSGVLFTIDLTHRSIAVADPPVNVSPPQGLDPVFETNEILHNATFASSVLNSGYSTTIDPFILIGVNLFLNRRYLLLLSKYICGAH